MTTTKPLRVLALALALAACSDVTAPAPKPSLTGRWAGEVDAFVPAHVILNLEEAAGEVAGWATVLPRGSDVAYLLKVTGRNAEVVTLEVFHPMLSMSLSLAFEGPDKLAGWHAGMRVLLTRTAP